MSEPRSFINSQTQTYDSLKTKLSLSANSKAKFHILNAHIAGSVVHQGELVIIGDSSTPSCTSQEAYLMTKANQVHTALLVNGAGADDFFLENFELLQQTISYTSMGIGAGTDGWSKHMDSIKAALQDIEKLYQDHLGTGVMVNRDGFYSRRSELFIKLEKLLSSFAAFGSGLREEASIKRLLGLSTSSYMYTGEIAGYADKVAGVASAAKWIKRGAYIGTALEVGSTGLSIHKACTLGREDQCRKARYVEGSALLGGLGGASAGGYLGGVAATAGCALVLGITTGPGALACGVVGGAAGGWAAGEGGKWGGEQFGDFLYGMVTK